jgi:WD40 repeat protein
VVRIWDPDTGTQTSTLTGHTDWVRAVAWSPDGTRLASAGGQVVRIWDRPPSRRGWLPFSRFTVRVGNSVLLSCLSIAPDGLRAAVGLDNGCVAFPQLDGSDQSEAIRVLGLPDGGWAVFYSDHSYRLNGHPSGCFWWSSGLCRFEPGELDHHGIQRID